MASHHHVPSSAALNALRGVVLTTSCSVVLLAEERRRRLQIARAAIENARKLHSIQNNRGPIAPTESRGTEKNRFAEVDDDTLSSMSIPRPRTSTRRRGRTQMLESDQAQATESREHGSRRTQPDRSRAESNNEHAEPRRATHFLGNGGLGTVSLNKLNLTSLSSNPPQVSLWKAPRRCPRLKTSNRSAASAIPYANFIGNKVASASAETHSKNTMDDNESANGTGSLQAAQQYLQTVHGNPDRRPDYDGVIPVLDRLLTELENPATRTDLHFERLNVVRTIFNSLVSFGPLPQAARPVKFQAFRLFRILARTSPENITTTLSSLLPLSKDPTQLLAPLIADLQSSNHRELLREVFLFLSRESTLSCSWADGKWVRPLLARLARSRQDFESTKKLYLEFQRFGLFSDIKVSTYVECQIRRTMIILALEAEENEYASTELQKLDEDHPGSSMSDFRLQQRIIMRKAISGRWEHFWSHMDMLRLISNSRCGRFQRFFTSVTDIFVTQGWNAAAVEDYLRKAVTDFNLRLEHRWVYAVLDNYASRRQADSAVSWLQFCGENGLVMDDSFNTQFFARCRKYWSFSEKAVRRFARLLENHGLARRQSLRPILGAGSSRPTDSGSPLKQAVVEQLECERPDVQRATQLVANAHSKGVDITDALTPLLIAHFAQGEDPRPLIDNALKAGVALHDIAYNKAAQALSTGGSHKAAVEMCIIAARENGKGLLLYNEYNFANLVYAYTGIARYTALQALLSEFTSETYSWHGSPICKNSIKMAMKTTAMRAIADASRGELHRQALHHLDVAFLHAKKCRATKQEKLSLTEAYVRCAKAQLPQAPSKARRQSRMKKHGAAMRHPCVAPHAGQTPVKYPVRAAASASA